MYMDTQLEDVLQYTERYPDRFVGLAGYNPFRIKQSLAEIELAVTKHGFKGVYVRWATCSKQCQAMARDQCSWIGLV